MDIRKQSTQAAIRQAFLSLRAKKAVEKITVKELCNLAQINKSTFYSHYQDIYDLSEQLQTETINFILSTITSTQEDYWADPERLTLALFEAMSTHYTMIETLFSGKERGYLADRIEDSLKELLSRRYPHYRTDPAKQILLTFSIQGGYHAYQKNQNINRHTLINHIGTISQQLKPLY